jgi:hypothetical protein
MHISKSIKYVNYIDWNTSNCLVNILTKHLKKKKKKNEKKKKERKKLACFWATKFEHDFPFGNHIQRTKSETYIIIESEAEVQADSKILVGYGRVKVVTIYLLLVGSGRKLFYYY